MSSGRSTSDSLGSLAWSVDGVDNLYEEYDQRVLANRGVSMQLLRCFASSSNATILKEKELKKGNVNDNVNMYKAVEGVCGGNENKEENVLDMTVRDVVTRFIIPQNKKQKCCLATSLRPVFKKEVSAATHLVSYSHNMKFGSLLNTLQSCHDKFVRNQRNSVLLKCQKNEILGPNQNDKFHYFYDESIFCDDQEVVPYFWIDVFAVDQYEHSVQLSRHNSEYWIYRDSFLSNLIETISSINNMLLVIDSVEKPLMLSRTWILFECYVALQGSANKKVSNGSLSSFNSGTSSNISIVYDDTDVHTNIEVFRNFDAVLESFKVDFEKSVTSNKREKAWLRHYCASLHPAGLSFCERRLQQFFNSFLVDYGLAVFDQKDSHNLINFTPDSDNFEANSENVIKVYSFMKSFSSLAKLMDQLGYAKPAYIMLKRLKLAVEDNLEVLSKLNKTSNVYDYSDEIFLLKELQADILFIAGCVAAKKLLDLKTAQNFLDESLQLYREVVKFDEANPSNFQLISKLCDTLQAAARLHQEKLEDAEARAKFEESIRRRFKTLGVSSLNELHLLLENQTLKNKLLAVKDCLISHNMLALFLQKTSDFVAAEDIFRKIIKIGQSYLGLTEDVFIWANNLAVCLEDQGKLSDAEIYYREVLKLSENDRKIGVYHKCSLNLLHNLGQNLVQQGLYSKAEKIFRKELFILRNLHGTRHKETLQSLQNLCFLLKAQDKKQEIQVLLRKFKIKRRAKPGTDVHAANNVKSKPQCVYRTSITEPVAESKTQSLSNSPG